MAQLYTTEDRATLVAHYRQYILEIAAALDLGRWAIVVQDGPTDDLDNLAEACQATYAEEGTIALGDLFFIRPRELQREIVVHECIHLHTKPFHLYQKKVLDVLGRSGLMGTLFEDLGQEYRETIVDRLAKTIARHFPLPPDHHPLAKPEE